METVLIFVLFIIGLIFIVKGGDYFVDAATWMAEVSGIPKFLIGATVVSFATTLPELLVSSFAAYQGKVDMSIGNAVGSVTANVGLIMAISIICMPAVFDRAQYMVKSIMLLLTASVLFLFSLNGTISLLEAIILLALFVIFTIQNIFDAKKSLGTAEKRKDRPTGKEIAKNLFLFAVGTAGIVIGADMLVDNGSAIARLFGVPESIIGVTIIAVGTSLPELVTTITAIAKKQSSLSIGNIIGANVIDLSMILPISSIISGGSLPVANQSRIIDMPVCLLIVVIALLPSLISQKFKRAQGITLLLLYIAYLFVVCNGFIA